jgi:signal transduction histidine kinase
VSLRRRLLITLGLSFVALWAVVAAWLYAGLQRQMTATLDQRLAASARMVSGLVAQMPRDVWQKAGAPVLSMPLSQGVACQISSAQGHVLMRTHGDFAGHFKALPQGFTDRVIDGHRWRLFTLNENGLHITTADRIAERHTLLQKVMLVAAVPFIVALVGSLLVLWLGLARGLRPLDRLRFELSQRAPDTLDPIEIRDAPAELVPAIKTLNRLLSRTNEALQREQRFTSDAAHELRTPLTAVKTHVQLASRVDGDRAHAALAVAETGIARLQRTLEQLLLLARVEADVIDTAARTLVTDIVTAAREDLLASGRIKEAAALPDVAVGVPQALAVAALRNLLDNALQHSSAEAEVSLDAALKGDCVTLTVADRGDWPADGNTADLTRRFWRARGGRGRARGSGLGLTVVQAIATRFGGRLSFTPRRGGGLIAVLTLPRAL